MEASRGASCGAFVEHHRDVGSSVRWISITSFGRKKRFHQMQAELDSSILTLRILRRTPGIAAVGEIGPPIHECVQAAGFLEDYMPGR